MNKTTICNFTTTTLRTADISIADIDNILFYDMETSKIVAVDAVDFFDGICDSHIVINKVSDINKLGKVYFANLGDFVAKHPNSHIEKYIADIHSEKVFSNFDKYIAAYAHIYRYYKSLAALAEKGYGSFIDSFIEACCTENTDHPATICYFGNEVYKILKLRKAVFNMFEKRLNDYNLYTQILTMQNTFKLKDSELRKLRKKPCDEIRALTFEMACRNDSDYNAFRKVNKKAIFEKLIAA